MDHYTKERVRAAYEAAHSEFDFLIKLFGYGDETSQEEGRKLMEQYDLSLQELDAKYREYRKAEHDHLFLPAYE